VGVRRTGYIGVVRASKVVGGVREVGIEFDHFSITANVGRQVEIGDQYRIFVHKEKEDESSK
jgi:hypothetical protein